MTSKREANQKHLTVDFKSYFKKLIAWMLSNKIELLILLFVILLAACLRLYKIGDYMTFLGDEGRDAIAIKKILGGHPVLLGPGTSIGNMYLGPLYYYIVAPSLLLAGYSPVGPSVEVALFGITTIIFVWYLTRNFFGRKAGLIAATAMAISPIAIIYSHSSWNPNIMPFFALLSMWSIWQVYSKKEIYWLPILGISLAAVLQSHYLGLLLFPIIGLYYLISLLSAKRDKIFKRFLAFSIFSGILFLVLMSPIVIFDARHGWKNTQAIKNFFSDRQTTVSFRPWNSAKQILPIWQQINLDYVSAKDEDLNFFVVWGEVGVLLYVALLAYETKKLPKDLNKLIFIGSWLVSGLIGLGLYKQQIYDHYFGFLIPAVFIFLGWSSAYILHSKATYVKIGVVALLLWGLFTNLKSTPILYPPNRQLSRTENIANHISAQNGNLPFNFAIIAERNYEDAYLYFFQIHKSPVVAIDPQNSQNTIKSVLYVVCELPEGKCDPTHNPKAEIANFGWSQIAEKENYEGVTIYKLMHY